MSRKTVENPFHTLETEAYDAFREWPLWLVLREKTLAAHTLPANAKGERAAAGRPAGTAPAGAAPQSAAPPKA